MRTSSPKASIAELLPAGDNASTTQNTALGLLSRKGAHTFEGHVTAEGRVALALTAGDELDRVEELL
jgi:hypothetical protein